MLVVTGGAGFIGSNLVAALEELGSHGIFDYDNFFNECGDKKLYSAQAVLDWLGY